MNIKPVNGHIVIEPLAHETFIATSRDSYEEKGTVVAIPDSTDEFPVKVGTIVYFDSWLAAKYPKNDTEHIWLVKWDDVRAIEYA